MIDWLLWYLVCTLLGWMAFPIAYRLLPGLNDRGYTASRAMGLLIWGYSFWLLSSLGILPFQTGGLLFAAAILLALSIWALTGIRRQEIADWLRSKKWLVLTTEMLFLAAFAGWTIVRAANPEAIGTEKPMELAFINAILRSPTFPPHDPWLSGYAISYYYFGYVITAMLAKITGTAGSVTFNLGTALVFALSACGAYGLVNNLLNAVNGFRDKGRLHSKSPSFLIASLLGPLYVLIVSNLEGFLHVLHTRGFFWQRTASGELSSPFWRWLDILDLSAAPQEPFAWAPTRFWWWWRASRVLQDYDLSGAPKEIIDEFPFFSFLLADLHPHVLAMPFAFLAIALALNLFLNDRNTSTKSVHLEIAHSWLAWVAMLAIPLGLIGVIMGGLRLSVMLIAAGSGLLIISGVIIVKLFDKGSGGTLASRFTSRERFVVELPADMGAGFILLSAITLGGLAFLNTWDFPVYVFLFAAAYGLKKVINKEATTGQAVSGFIWVGAALGASGIVLYLPFYLGFSSQAGGLIPNLVYPTRGAHLWVMFGPLLVPILAYLIHLHVRLRDRRALRTGLIQAAGIYLVLALIVIFLATVIVVLPQINQLFLSSIGTSTTGGLLREAVMRRLTAPGGWLTLFILMTLVLGLIPQLRRISQLDHEQAGEEGNGEPTFQETHTPLELSGAFVVLLIFTGLLLVLAPEFVYLRDMFGWRMNTIFKFYFQAWLIWGIAAVFGAVILIIRLKGFWSLLFRLGLALLFLASLTYPVLSLWSKTNGFRPGNWSLDSTAYFTPISAEETAAIEWLKTAPYGVVAEAVPETGGSYSEFARAATFTGLPGVLGWVGHENQWRGGNQAIGSRQSDLERLYCSREWEEARSLLDQYQIRYVFVGKLERAVYVPKAGVCPSGMIEAKFQRHLNRAFEMGDVVIYEYSSMEDYEIITD